MVFPNALNTKIIFAMFEEVAVSGVLPEAPLLNFKTSAESHYVTWKNEEMCKITLYADGICGMWCFYLIYMEDL